METRENWGPYLYDLLLKSQYLKQCLKKKKNNNAWHLEGTQREND